MQGEAYLEKDVLQHPYQKKKGNKKKTGGTKKSKIPPIICQVINCEHHIANFRTCKKQDCIANGKFMCSFHGPKHELHENCSEWKADSDSATKRQKKIQQLQMDPLIQQYVQEQVRLAVAVNQNLQPQTLTSSAQSLQPQTNNMILQNKEETLVAPVGAIKTTRRRKQRK